MNAEFTIIPRVFLTDYEWLAWFDSDFTIGRAFYDDESFFWNSASHQHEQIRKRSFVDYLHANSLCTGLISLMGHLPGTVSVLSLTSNIPRKPHPETAAAVMIVGNAPMVKAAMLGFCPEISIDEATSRRLLTPIQCEVLDWIAEGKSNLDIGTIINLRGRTVRYHVSEILRKLAVAARTQAAVSTDHLRSIGRPGVGAFQWVVS